MAEWKECTIGDICNSISETYSRHDDYVVLINTSDVLEGKFLTHKSSKNEDLKGQFKKTFTKDDILYSEIRPANKRYAFVDFDNTENYIASTKLMVIRPNKTLVLPNFLYLLLTSKNLIDEMQHLAETRSGTFPQITFSGELATFPINLPPLTTQKKISDILSCIDAKIELNNKINDNLEQQAQTVFKEIFADKIKNVSEIDGKPLGTLIDIVDNRGKTPPSSNEKNEFPILDVGALNSVGRIIDYKNCTKYVDEQTYSTFFRDGHPHENDILLSTVGSLAQMKFFKGDKGCIAQNVVAFRTLSISPFYLYEYLKFIKNDLLSYDIGSVQPSIKVTHIIKHLIYIPKNEDLSKFDSCAKAITEQIYNHVCENERLIALRDALLPKLMSGEIDVDSVQI
ncbi:MAG: restriction endonuclease subunit S [Treponema sp.]|nr:restriction endonuclease subunit S [Treponema sp.]